MPVSSLFVRRVASALFAISLTAGCNSSDSNANVPVVTTVTVALAATTISVGQTDSASASALDQNNAIIVADSVTWSSSSAAIATVTSAGIVTGVSAGTAQITAVSHGKSGQKSVTVNAPTALRVNEVESSGGTPGDWIELYNPTTAAVDLSGWILKDNDDTHIYTFPAGKTIAAGGYVTAEEADLGFGLGAPDAARLYSPFRVLVDSFSWTAHAATTYGRCPNGSGAFVTMTTVTKAAVNNCSPAASLVKVNEVESDAGSPGDWIELYNPGASPAAVGGLILRDNDDTHLYRIPAGTTIAAGGFYVAEEADLGFGLGSADAARLFDSAGTTLLDSFSWTAHATTTYGRCPDGSGAFATTVASTKGAANSCAPSGSVAAPWPGSDAISIVDGVSVFGGNLSGLTYEAGATAATDVLWGARNGPGSIFRLVFNGTIWTPDFANGWTAGKALHYPNGTGDPDAEGITFASGGSAGGLYVSVERNNSDNGVSRNSVLRFDPAQAGTTLVATNEWNLTADLPANGANLGAEAVTWIPDSFLVAQGFVDEKAGHLYSPAEYPNHGSGLFAVGIEATGNVYVYALNSDNTFSRLATFNSGFTAVMDLHFDREIGYLWAVCDDGCGGNAMILEIDQTAGAGKGHFHLTHTLSRPVGMPNFNNEGFTFQPLAECAAGFRKAFWSDDTEDGGHAIRQGTVMCSKLP